MALLPEDQQSQYRLLGIILLAGLGAAFWMYVYQPRAQEVQQREERLESLESWVDRADAASGQIETLRQELDRRQQQLEALRRLVPSRSEVATLYETVATESEAQGLQLLFVTPQEAQPDSASGLSQRDWEMSVRGGFHNAAAFVTQVASLDRLVRPRIQSIRPDDQEDTEVQEVAVDLRLVTYVMPQDTASGGGTAGGGQ